MEVIARIDASIPAGRKILRELESKRKGVKLEYPKPDAIAGQKTYTVEESFDKCCDILSAHYGVDVRKL